MEAAVFSPKSADSTDRVEESSGRDTKAVYHAQRWGNKLCDAGLILAQVVFHVQSRCFSIHCGLMLLINLNDTPGAGEVLKGEGKLVEAVD